MTDSTEQWASIYRNQVERGSFLKPICDGLDLGPGESVVDLGCGPGYTTLRLAEHVDPGTVYAVDRAPGALRYLERRATEAAIGNARSVACDLATFALRFDDPLPLVLTFVLHHADDPERVVAELGGAIPGGSRLLIAEYDPSGAGDVGPSLDRRLLPAAIQDWLTEYGFRIEDVADHPEEKYSMVAVATVDG